MEIIPVHMDKKIRPGDDLPSTVVNALRKSGIKLRDGDVIAVAQSVVSKAEGRIVKLRDVRPSEKAKRIAKKVGKDPREVEIILRESARLVRVAHVLIAQTKHGFVCGNAGVDRSNAPPGCVTLLPSDPDWWAEKIRERIQRDTGARVAVVITDSQGRPFRMGAVGYAIGVAGMKPRMDLKGKKDLYGRKLRSTGVCPADALAAAAVLVMGEGGEKIPIIVVRGAPYKRGEGKIKELLRPRERDLFL